MPKGPELIISIVTDASKAGDGLKQAEGKFAGLKQGLGSLAAPAAGVLAGITALGVGALNSASDLQQAMGSIDAVFGASSGQIKKWASEASDAVGLSTAQYSEFAAVLGSQLKNLGVPFDQIAGQTDEMIRLGADLAATYGGTTADAVSALGSALRGEADPAERYGLALNQTAVNAKLAEQGMGDLTGEALSAAKAQAILEMATTQAGGAVGSFASEADTLAGQQQRLTAKWEDASAALGEALLPLITPMVAALGDFSKFVQENATVIGPLIAAVAALAAGILVLNVVMSANPIGLIIAAVAALIVGIIVLWNTNEEFRNFFINMWKGIASFFTTIWKGLQSVVGAVVSWFQDAWRNVSNFFRTVWQVALLIVQAYFNAYKAVIMAVINAVRAVVKAVVDFFVRAWRGAVDSVTSIVRTLSSVFRSVMDAILVPIGWVVDAFNNVVGAIQDVIGWLGKIKIPDLGAIGDFFGGGRSATGSSATFAATPSAFGVAGRSSVPLRAAIGGGGGGTVINVQGGLDSADSIARRVAQLLGDRQRRAGGVTITRSTR